MADADNLDSLSNAELRAQMIAQGLPNIPVTDSSRKVLVKRLRASLGGNTTLPASSSTNSKKTADGRSNRRETIQPGAAAGDKVDNPTKSRRSIAAVTTAAKNDVKLAEHLRKPEAVVAQPPPRQAEAVTIKSVVVPPAAKAAPIQSRRSSATAERREVVTTAAATATAATRKPEPIAEEVVSNENTLEVNSLIVLESDEEEDEQLAQAAQSAEHQFQLKHQTQSIYPKLTTTTTSSHQYVSSQATESIGERRARAFEAVRSIPAPSRSQAPSLTQPSGSYSQAPSLAQPTNWSRPALLSQPSSLAQPRSTIGGYGTGRYTSSASSSTSYVTTGSNYRRSPPRTYTNEFSDETGDDEDAVQQQQQHQQPATSARFESDFARKLATLRSERIGDRSSPYNRRTIAATTSTTNSGSNYEPVARRSLRGNNNDHVSASVAFGRFLQSLDRSYKLKSKIFVGLVLLLLYIVYKIYN